MAMFKIIISLLLLAVLTACGGKTKEELYAEGLKYLETANPGGAVVLFKNALEKDENYLDARYQLAKCYARLGKWPQAEKEFNKVIKQNPSRDDVLLELAGVLNALKKSDEAFKLGERYLEKHPGSVEGIEVMGMSCAVAGRYEEAERYLLQAVAADTKRIRTKLELAAVYVSAGKEPKARILLEELTRTDRDNPRPFYMLATLETRSGNHARAMELYRTITAANPSETLAAYKTGLLHIENGDTDQADRIAGDLLTRFPKSADGPRLKGLVCYHRKNYAEALNYLQGALKTAPTLETYHFIGLCYYHRGELESALSQFRRILDHVPESRQARLMTGTILTAQKRVDDAVTEIQKVLQKNDRDAVAHNLLGNAYMAKGMFDDGMKEFSKATRIDPKIVDAYLKRGYFYFSRGKDAEGESELTSAVKAVPDAVNSRLLLASYHLRSGRAAKALTVLKSGLTGQKSDAVILNGIAAVHFSENRRDEGLKSIGKAKEVDPSFTASYQNLATYFTSTGAYGQAVAEYTALLKIEPDNAAALLHLAGLQEMNGNGNEAVRLYQKAVATKQPAAVLAMANHYQSRRENAKALTVLEDALKDNGKNLSFLEMKGQLLLKEKKYKEAVKVFEEVEAVNPELGMGLKINTYVAMKDQSKAVAQARRIIEKSPGSARGYLYLGSIYEKSREYARAISEVKNGLRVDSSNARAIVYLGTLYEASGDVNQAMAAYEDACRKTPDYIPAIYAQGALLDQTGKKKEAMGKYRAVLEKSDSYVPALNNLAYLCATGYGSREEALRLAVSAYKREPGNAGVLDTLGLALLKNARPEDSRKVLEKAVGLLPENPTVVYHLGLAYKESGDRANALKTLQKAVSLGSFDDSKAAAATIADLNR